MVAIVALKTSGLIEMFWGENCGKCGNFAASLLFLTWAAWEAKEEQVFIQARSLATWSAVDGVYLVMSGVHTAGLTGAPAPQPVMLGVLGVVAPKSGLMFAAV